MDTQNDWKPKTKSEKGLYIAALCFGVAGLITCTLYMLEIHHDRALYGLFFSLMMICYGLMYRKRKLPLAILMWLIALFAFYTVADTVLRDHFGIFIGKWRH